jgi:blue copper oxidase
MPQPDPSAPTIAATAEPVAVTVTPAGVASSTPDRAEGSIQRRRLLKAAVTGLASGGAYLLGARDGPFSSDRLTRLFGVNSARARTTHDTAPAEATADFRPDIELELNAIADEVSFLPGAPTAVWRFTGKVLRGEANALTFLDGAAGAPRFVPVIKVRRGQKIRVFFNNRLPEDSIVHWHGLHIVQRMDGHPMYAIGSGKRYVYEFAVGNRAGTYWFHPHPHGRTGYQIYSGLAGLFLVGDEEEDAARLPSGDFDLPMVIQDRSFDQGNQLIYLGRGMMERMMGFMGERVLVNANPDYVRQVERRAHRLRLFNGSNASGYRLSLSDGRPFVVIGTDGGLLEQAMTRQSLTLAVAERIDVWVDFGTMRPGQELSLVAKPFAPMMASGGQPGMMGMRGMMGMMGRGGDSESRTIARFRAGNGAAAKSSPPKRLSKFPALSVRDAFNRERPRQIRLSMMRGQVFLNGRTFEMESVAEDERVRLGATEVWEFVNDTPMAHPMHLHNLHFKVIQRTGAAGSVADAAGLSAGFTDEGLKDVVLVLPGERVRVLMKFEDYTGLYLYHCHILEHEDLGMMRNYLVGPD